MGTHPLQERHSEQPVDLFVIGGGINGCDMAYSEADTLSKISR